MPDVRSRPAGEPGGSGGRAGALSGSLLDQAGDNGVNPALTEAEARSLTGQIRSLGEGIADRVDLLVDKVRQARDGQAHVALGYKSWTEYVQNEFAGVLPRLDRQSRRELVTALTETGMSSRAIALVVGVSQSTVADDVTSSGHLLVEATDNQFEQAITEARTDGDLSRANVEQKITAIPTNNVVGIDGKSYPRPEPRKERRPSRSPLPDAYGSAVFRLEKAVKSLQRLHADDRFLRSRAELKERNGRTISNAFALLMSIEGDLDGHQCRVFFFIVWVNSEFYTECEACR